MKQHEVVLGEIYKLKDGTEICADSHCGVEYIGYLDEDYGTKRIVHISEIVENPKILNTLEIFTTEIKNIQALLRIFNLFYYLSNANYSDETKHLTLILDDIQKEKYKVAKFNGWLILNVENVLCRLSIENLKDYTNDIMKGLV